MVSSAPVLWPLDNLRMDVVGSLLRPQWLKTAAARYDAGEIDLAELREVQDRAIREVIAHQESIGLPPQCGFASDVSGNLLSEDDEWRKLERVVEVARDVWR